MPSGRAPRLSLFLQERKEELFCLAAVVLVNLWSCWPAFSHPLLSDEIMWLETSISGKLGVWEFADSFEKGPGAWRPFGGIYWWLLPKIFGASPLPYHALEWFVYLCWTLSAGWLTALISRSRSTGIAAFLLMFFLPTRFAGGINLMSCLINWSLLFGTLFLALSLKNIRQRSLPALAGAQLCFIAALLSHSDSFIIWPISLCLTALFPEPRERKEPSDRRALISLLASAATLGLYLYIRVRCYPNRDHTQNLESLFPETPTAVLFERYHSALSFMFQEFLGTKSLRASLLENLLPLSACGLLLSCAASRLLKNRASPKNPGALLAASLACLLLGLFPVFYFPERLAADDLYRPSMAFLGLAWSLCSIPSLLRLKPAVIPFLLCLLWFDSSYFRHPHLSPHRALASRLLFAATVEDNLLEIPRGSRIAMWDNRSVGISADFLSRRLRIFNARNQMGWTIAYFGLKPRWVTPVAAPAERFKNFDVLIWPREIASPENNLVPLEILQASFSPSGRTIALAANARGDRPALEKFPKTPEERRRPPPLPI